MAIIRPFNAIRPTRDKASLVASRSYLSYSDRTLQEKLDNNPFTFLHIINPNYTDKIKKHGIEKFKLIKQKFTDFNSKGTLLKDKKKSLYLYSQKKNQKIFTGIIAAISINDYLNKNIKIHEKTIKKRENLFKDYLRVTGFNADPVMLTYADNENIDFIISNKMQERSEYEFTTTNKVCHQLWKIDDKKIIDKIVSEFKKINNIYIADGHHRSSSSSLLCKNLRKENPHYNPKDNFNFFMSFLIPESQLNIINFNRLVKHTNGLSVKELIAKIEKSYYIENKGSNIYSPILKNEISMYLKGKWYSLIAHSKKYNSVSESLDPSTLSKNILSPILGITDETTNDSITFFDGTIPLSDIKTKIDNEEYKLAFILKPIDINALKEVANNNETMPPKSTYIEPKLRSGLTIYELY